MKPLLKSDPAISHALAVDTTSEYLSLALWKDGQLAAQYYKALGTAMNRRMLGVLDELLSSAGLTAGALQLVIAARGPGSFTGTRLGLALARSIAQVQELPLIGVNTLRLLAAQLEPQGQAVQAVLNCSRDELYHAPFCWDQAGQLQAAGKIRTSTFAALAETIGATPVILRRLASQQDGHEQAIAALHHVQPQHPHPDGALLLQQGLRLYRELIVQGHDPTQPDRWPAELRAELRAEPLYLKSEALRTWTR